MIRITENKELSSLTSFGTSATANRLIEWSSAEALADFLRGEGGNFLRNGEKWTILGHGCNTLFTEDYKGTILLSTATGMETIFRNDHYTLIRANAGEVWDNVVARCTAEGLWGAENLSGARSAAQGISPAAHALANFSCTCWIRHTEQRGSLCGAEHWRLWS